MPVTRYQLARFLANIAYKEGKVTLRSGVESNYYFDKMELFARPELVNLAARMMIDHMLTTDDPYVKHIIAPETGGAMLAIAMQQILYREYHSELKLHVYRKDGTLTGVHDTPIGNYIIVEDVITSGQTVYDLLTALNGHTAYSPEQAIALIDRGGDGVKRLRGLRMHVSTLFDEKELLSINGRDQSDPAQE